jgi:hypothetical protein
MKTTEMRRRRCWDDIKDIDKVNMQKKRLDRLNVSENSINQHELDE